MKKNSIFIFLVLLYVIYEAPFLRAAVGADGDPNHSDSNVSYLGPEGTYTQEACLTFFIDQGECSPYSTVKDAVEALLRNDVDFAVIPQENTIGGAVIDYIDILIAQTGLYVMGEVELPITQNLLVRPGTTLQNIKTVYSHKQGIAQGKEWLNANLPGAEVIEVASTAQGARLVSESSDLTSAAIASASSAEVYGLKILAAGIQNNDDNKTRFYILSTEEMDDRSPDRIAFIAMGAAEYLPLLMEQISQNGMKLIAIHDRPLKTRLGEYYYLIECAGGDHESYLVLADESPFKFRYLGSYDVY